MDITFFLVLYLFHIPLIMALLGEQSRPGIYQYWSLYHITAQSKLSRFNPSTNFYIHARTTSLEPTKCKALEPNHLPLKCKYPQVQALATLKLKWDFTEGQYQQHLALDIIKGIYTSKSQSTRETDKMTNLFRNQLFFGARRNHRFTTEWQRPTQATECKPISRWLISLKIQMLTSERPIYSSEFSRRNGLEK